jgi:hypothetical protein
MTVVTVHIGMNTGEVSLFVLALRSAVKKNMNQKNYIFYL